MSYKIGIFGSAVDEAPQAIEKALELAEAISKYKDITLVTGTAVGMPLKVASRAHKLGTKIWGYSPATNLELHKKCTPDDKPEIYEKIVYIPESYEHVHNIRICRKYRNVTSTAIVDARIIISGRWGTLNEFTNLVDMGKLIGVLTGTSGIADELLELVAKVKKEIKGGVIFENDPKDLVEKMYDKLSSAKTL